MATGKRTNKTKAKPAAPRRPQPPPRADRTAPLEVTNSQIIEVIDVK